MIILRPWRKRRPPLCCVAWALVALLFHAFPAKILAFSNGNHNHWQRAGSGIPSSPLWAATSDQGSLETAELSPIYRANEALKNLDVQSAESFLMTAVAQVNGAVMNNPSLLKCFEDLFRTKIDIAQAENSGTMEVAYAIAQDRMGLASLLTDQSKYQEAADELELAVRSLSVLASTSGEQQQYPVSDLSAALDKASSLLFRTRAMVCDWGEYDQSCQDLSKSTQSALSQGALPSVHPFEALAWPCLSLRDATYIAHEYGKRAIATTTNTAQTPSLPWTNLEDRLPREDVPFVRAITSSLQAGKNSNPIRDSNRIIKVGYLSPDFTGRHPLAFLMQDVFRFHDTSRFEIVLYSLGGEPDGSPEVEKILHGRGSEDGPSRNWKTLEGSIEAMAQCISQDNLDVVIDLCGYTGTSLVAEVMACLRSLESKSKPVHVAYMGFPGSSGAPYIDYMIADEVVIPSKFRPWYTENVLYMPHCYFVNSHWHIKANNKANASQHPELPVTREDYELPASPAFVFCCHSRPDKIDPSTFCTWIRALKRTRAEGRAQGNPGMAQAVLWLLRSTGAPQMEGNLMKVAQSILDDEKDKNAIVFCDQAPRNGHLERLALADLYLDTPAYNAHTVGCDCLSAGVPMISLLLPWHQRQTSSAGNGNSHSSTGSNSQPKIPTEKLASRVGASLLKSAGSSSLLSDALVVSSMEEYEDRMVECAASSAGNSIDSDASNFATLKHHLLDEFATAPLWDTERWVRNLETGLATMVDLQTKGSCETDIYVMDYSDTESNQKP